MFVFVASNVFATTVPLTAVAVNTVGAVGAVVSITSALLPARDDAPPTVGRVSVALLPAVSRMVAEFSASAVTAE